MLLISHVHVATASAGLLPLVTEFWTTPAVVDEPVADLCHANSGSLVSSQLSYYATRPRGF